MNYSEWKERTGRGATKIRSGSLHKIDKELKKLGETGMLTDMSSLRKALNDWKASKGGFWQQSIRNHDGAVDELDRLINGNARVFQQAALQARLAQARQDNAEIAVNELVRQKFGANDVDFANVEFAWNVVFGIVKRGTAIEVKVRVAGTLVDETGTKKKHVKSILTNERAAFKTHIQSAWNIATVVVNQGGKDRFYDLIFDLEWVDGASDASAYQININKLHPDTANRDNLLNWLFGNREACIHEFGHMIGCPDEYNTVEVRGFGHVIHDPAMYSQPGYSTNSIMNNPGSVGRIHERHFNFVAIQIRRLMKAETKVKILRRIGPSQTQELNQFTTAAIRSRRTALGFTDD